MNDTLSQLRTDLRYRLNDADSGNFTDAELLQCINYAIRETELVTKCHIDTMEVVSGGQIDTINDTPVAGGTGYSVGDILTLATGTGGTVEVIQVAAGVVIRVKLLTRGTSYSGLSTYATTSSPSSGRSGCTVRVNSIRGALVSGTYTCDTGPIFEPIEVSLHWTTTDNPAVVSDTQLDPKPLAELKSTASWNTTASGKPVSYARLSGSKIRLYPTPDRASSTDNYLRVHGYAVSAGLSSDYDRPTSIPDGYRVPCILERAEAEARKMRLTTIPNVNLYTSLMQRWDMWCKAITESLKGVGR